MGGFQKEGRLSPHPLPTESGLHRGIWCPSSAPAPHGAVLSSLYRPARNRTLNCTFGYFLTHNLHMATFYKIPSGWRAQVARQGVRKSRAGFPTKTAAKAWADKVEAEILGGEVPIPNLTLDAVFERYARDVSEGKKGAKWEKARIGLVRRDPLALVRLRDFGKVDVASWRDRRLQAVSAASVRREWNLLNHACNLAVGEWGWLKVNPFKLVKRPADGKARSRIATDGEIARLTESASPNMRRVIVFALETGMRAGEIASLTASNIRGQVAVLDDTKNGTSREVPLSKVALQQINGGVAEIRESVWSKAGTGDNSPDCPCGADKATLTAGSNPAAASLFNLTAGSISGLFAKMCRDLKIEGLTFHDLRRTAIVRLSKKLDPMTLAKVVGHRDLKMTLNVYYQINAADVAALLD